MPKYNHNMPSETYDLADYEALRASNIPASLIGTKSMHFDSAEDASVFFARELDFIKSQTYDVEYPELTALSLFPQSSEVDPGAETATYYSYEKTGMAKLISNYATDLVRVDVKGKPTTVPIKSVGDSFGYSVQEMRASRYAGKALDARKADAAKYAIDRKINEIAWVGDADTGLIGVLSPNNDIPVYTLPQNMAQDSTRWEDKTVKEILADWSSIMKWFSTTTLGVERPDTVGIAEDVWTYLDTTPFSDLSERTILSWILENHKTRIKDIVPCPELNAGSGQHPFGEQSVAIFFTKDRKKLEIEIPMPFYQHPIQPAGLEIEVPCEARILGAIIYYPLSALIVPGI